MLLQTWLADLQSASAQKRHEAALILGTLERFQLAQGLVSPEQDNG